MRCGVLIGMVLFGMLTFSNYAGEAATLETKGIAALKQSQTDPNSVVAAAIFFGKAADAYEKAGDDAKATDMNSFLYWCKKKMTIQQMDTFLKGGDAAAESVGKRMKELEKTAPPKNEAKTYFDRAEAYAKAHTDEHLLIAVRFYEIAERFKGTEIGSAAQDRSLNEMVQASNKPTAKETKAKTSARVPDESKIAVPTVAQQKEAEKAILELYQDDFGKMERAALARKLVEKAGELTDDPAGRYEMLVLAANVAATGGELYLMYEIFDALNAAYDGDLGILIKFNLGLVMKNTHDPIVTKLAAAHRTLFDKPEDIQANLTFGKYLFFVRGDFDSAVPLLAKAIHPGLNKAAKLDLAGPEETTAQIAVGDAWWDLAEKTAEKDEKPKLRERAGYWYCKAFTTTSGLNKTKLEKRIEAAGMRLPIPNSIETQFVDLLKVANPQADAIEGEWVLDNGILRCLKPVVNGRFQLHSSPTRDYDFRAVFTVKSQTSNVCFTLVHGFHPIFLWLNGWENTYAGIGFIDDRDPLRNGTKAANSLVIGETYDVTVQVRKKAIRVFLNGKLLIDYKFEFAHFIVNGDWKMRDDHVLGLFAQNSEVDYKSVQIAEAPPEPTRGKIAAEGAPVDLLKLVNPVFDSYKGDWALADAALTIATERSSQRIRIPYRPTPEYDLHIVFTRMSEKGDLGPVLVHGQNQVEIVLASEDGTIAGLNCIHSKWAKENSSRKDFKLKSHVTYDMRVQVRLHSIKVILNDEEVFTYKSPHMDFSVEEGWNYRDPYSLAWNCNKSRAVIKTFEVIDIGGEGTDRSRIHYSNYMGKRLGFKYEDLAEAGSCLVGFKTLQHTSDKTISSLQAIFRSDDGKVSEGVVHGRNEDDRKELVAKPGYAVAGVVAQSGERITGFKVVFAKVVKGAFDLADSYESEWVGGHGKEETAISLPTPAVGIYGTHGTHINSAGFITIEEKPDAKAKP